MHCHAQDCETCKRRREENASRGFIGHGALFPYGQRTESVGDDKKTPGVERRYVGKDLPPREHYAQAVTLVAIEHNGKQTYFESRSLANAMTVVLGQQLTQEQRDAYAELARAFARAVSEHKTG